MDVVGIEKEARKESRALKFELKNKKKRESYSREHVLRIGTQKRKLGECLGVFTDRIFHVCRRPRSEIRGQEISAWPSGPSLFVLKKKFVGQMMTPDSLNARNLCRTFVHAQQSWMLKMLKMPHEKENDNEKAQPWNELKSSLYQQQ